MEICLIRHTTPAIEKGICYGQSDLSLASTYAEELLEVKKNVIGAFDRIYSSPLKRCSQLAKDLFPTQEISFDPRLMELDFGDWEMVPWTEMDRKIQEKWMENFVLNAPPNGESMLQLKDRLVKFLSTIQEDRVALVTHSGVIRTILAIVEQTPLEKCFDYQLSYGEVKTIDFEKMDDLST